MKRRVVSNIFDAGLGRKYYKSVNSNPVSNFQLFTNDNYKIQSIAVYIYTKQQHYSNVNRLSLLNSQRIILKKLPLLTLKIMLILLNKLIHIVLYNSDINRFY